jgi:uncharacterized protein (DUF2384 family)
VTLLRLRSAERPFSDVAVAGQAARLLALAEGIGIWQPRVLIEVLDRNVFVEVLESVAMSGVARHAPLDWERYAEKTPEAFATWIKTVRDDIAASPVPELELPKLDMIFGTDRLASSVGVASSSMRRYLAQDRDTPDEVAARAHLLARMLSDLAGSYNERGIRRWFERPRSQLGGRAPQDILSGPWDPDEPEVIKVAALAAERAG